MNRWYVVNTKSREESKAFFNLSRQGFNAYLPKYKKTSRHARKTNVVLAPLFPKYLFVEFDMDMKNWSCINSTLGVKELIKFGPVPTPVPLGLIDDIRAKEDKQGAVLLNRRLEFKKGDQITIVSGALSNHIGIFESQNDEARVIILMNLLGRGVRVQLPSSSISA